jgi:hypothetical protein
MILKRRTLWAKPETEFRMTLSFAELAELHSAAQLTLRSVHTRMPVLEELVGAIEDLYPPEEEPRASARAGSPEPRTLNPEPSPVLLLGPGGQYQRAWPAAPVPEPSSPELVLHLVHCDPV